MNQLVVFLHAFPLDSRMWEPQLGAIPADWDSWCPDFRGFGDAAPDAVDESSCLSSSLDDYASDVLQELNARGVERAVFCGCSMGGYVALAVLRLAPERVAGLVLADTRATADTPQGRANRLAMLDVVDREGPEAVVSQMAQKLVGQTTRDSRPEVNHEIARMSSRATAGGIRQAIIRMLNRPDSTAALSEFDGPVLVIVGAEDELTPVADAEAMAAASPAAALVVVPGAGHLANLEAPDAFNAALRAFLAGRVPSSAGPPVPTP